MPIDDSTSSPIWKLIDVIARSNSNFKPHHVRLNSTTKKLLIRLVDGTTREDLEGLKVKKNHLSEEKEIIFLHNILKIFFRSIKKLC